MKILLDGEDSPSLELKLPGQLCPLGCIVAGLVHDPQERQQLCSSKEGPQQGQQYVPGQDTGGQPALLLTSLLPLTSTPLPNWFVLCQSPQQLDSTENKLSRTQIERFALLGTKALWAGGLEVKGAVEEVLGGQELGFGEEEERFTAGVSGEEGIV